MKRIFPRRSLSSGGPFRRLLLAGAIPLLWSACSDDDDDDTLADDDDTADDDDDDDTLADDDDTADDDDDDTADGCDRNLGPDYPEPEEEPVAPFAGRLGAEVTVHVDAFGMSHIVGASDEDLLFVQGYRQAHDRLFQMELYRRLVEGTQAEIFGDSRLADDREARVAGFRRLAEAYLPMFRERYPSLARRGDAFIGGINAYLADARAERNGATFGPEWDRVEPGFRPADWEMESLYAFALAQAFALSFSGDRELIFSAAGLLLGADVAADVLRFQPMQPTYITEPEPAEFPPEYPPNRFARIGGEGPMTPNADPRVLIEMARRWSHLVESIANRSGGSNNWTVAGRHTAAGESLVADDPHLGVDLPANFWETHLINTGSGVNFIGIQIPAFPGVLIGHNEQIGWGLTTAFGDVTDLYLEALSEDGTTTLFRGEPAALEFIDEPIRVRPSGGSIAAAETVDFRVRVVPHHGPIMNDLLPEDFAEAIPFTVSFRWVGFEPIYAPGFVFSALNAGSLDRLGDALRFFGVGAQNFNAGDTDGRIEWWAPSHYPNREWDTASASPANFLNASGDFEWCGFLPFDEGVPHMADPAKGYIVTANNTVFGETLDNDPGNEERFYGHFYDAGTRAYRITRRLEQLTDAGGVTLQDMQALQNDVHSVIADDILPYALTEGLRARLCPAGEEGAESRYCRALTLLETWDRNSDRASVGATIFHYWHAHQLVGIFQDDIPEFLWGAVSNNDLLNVLIRPERLVWAGYDFPSGIDYADNRDTDFHESLEDVAHAALVRAVDQLTAALGEDFDGWRWGGVHRKTFVHQAKAPGFEEFARGPFENDGGLFDVRRSDYNILTVVEGQGPQVLDPPLQQVNGSSMRLSFQMDPAAGFPTCNALPGGNSGRPDSPHYDDQIAMYIEGQCRRLPFTMAEVEAAAVSRFTFPAGFPAVNNLIGIGLGE